VLRIRSAKFMWKDRYGKPQWIAVARMLELAEIYVPYDNGWTAILDIHDMPFHITPARKEFLGPNCVLPGEILPSSNLAWSGTVHKEVHDDGIRWMSAETDDRNQIADRARRGEKMILWSTYYGANYRYLIEYSFGDDGMITCRLGPTGRNIFNRQEDQRDTHLHIGCWRLEFDLGDPSSGTGGPKDNDVLLVRRVFDEVSERFGQIAKPFAKNSHGQACEGSARWSAEDFTAVRVQSRVRKNAHGRPVAFDLIPQRVGALRQLQPEGGTYATDMDFINYDFWVTRTESGFTDYIDVPHYASQRRPLTGYPTTVWHCTPALHFPRGEDFGSEDGKSSYAGLAITFWTGFYVKPRDLFDSTPLYEPRRRPLR
jgi:Cu2+-containing amine oxidase